MLDSIHTAKNIIGLSQTPSQSHSKKIKKKKKVYGYLIVTRNTVSVSSENTNRMKRLNKVLANKSLIP